MHIILSCGQGPLHFVSSARFIAALVDRLDFICGYVPKREDSIMLRLLARLKGKVILSAIKRHRIEDANFNVCSCGFAEAIQQVVNVLCLRMPRLFKLKRWERVPWLVFGWQSCWHIAHGDIFHVRSGAGHGGAIAKARRLGMKVVVDHSIAHPAFMDQNMRSEYERNDVQFHMGMGSPFWRMIDDECRAADVVQVNSQFVKDTFIAAGYDQRKIRVVYLGVRSDFWGLRKHCADSRKLRLLFTGGFGFRKGAEYLLAAMRILKDRGIEFEMDVVGDFSSARALIDRYRQYNLPITFHGQKPQDELKAFLANGDIYVFPSLAEGCAQSGMEAMAAGMCVIGTHESGFPITDGEDGYVVPCKDANAIADRVEWLSRNREEIDRTGKNAAKLIRENYTWEKYAENVKNLYVEILGRKA